MRPLEKDENSVKFVPDGQTDRHCLNRDPDGANKPCNFLIFPPIQTFIGNLVENSERGKPNIQFLTPE